MDALADAVADLADWSSTIAYDVGAMAIWLPELERSGPTWTIVDRVSAAALDVRHQVAAGNLRARAVLLAANAARLSLREPA